MEKTLLENLIFFQLAKNFLFFFVEPAGSLPYSQEPILSHKRAQKINLSLICVILAVNTTIKNKPI
jgi:hypothetical protein